MSTPVRSSIYIILCFLQYYAFSVHPNFHLPKFSFPLSFHLLQYFSMSVLYDFLDTVKAVPHECVIRTGQP